MPGGTLVGSLIYGPLILLAGVYFLQSSGWRMVCRIVLSLWLIGEVVFPVIHHDYAKLIFPFLIIVLWLIMAGVERGLKD